MRIIPLVSQCKKELKRIKMVDNNSSLELISDIECPFQPIIAEGDGSPLKRSADLIKFDDSKNFNSSRPLGDESFEAFGGNSSVLDPTDLKTEIAQLKFEIQKLNEECAELKRQNSAYQDENMILSSEKEDLQRKLVQKDMTQEKVRHLQRELDEARQQILRVEDLNSILRSKIQRQEREFTDLELKNRGIKDDFTRVSAELEKCYAKVRGKDDEINRVNLASKSLVEEWVSKYTALENQLNDMNKCVEELTNFNLQLRKEKIELERNLVDVAGNHLLHLNGDQGSPEDDGCSCYSSPRTRSLESPIFASPQSYLGRSLQAEIAATYERKRSIQLEDTLPLSQISIELVDATTQSERSDDYSCDEGFWSSERCLVDVNEMLSIITHLKDLQALLPKREEVKEDETDQQDGDNAAVKNGSSIDRIAENGPTITTDPVEVVISSSAQDEVVRRINAELAEFREQLKRSQEIIHALQNNGSVSAASLASVTQSCPTLTASQVTVVAKPSVVNCSTQTEPSRRLSEVPQDLPVRSLLEAIQIDDDGDVDPCYLDKLSDDDISYRLTINLPTVLEESDQETETSPGFGLRRMSSLERMRRKGKLMRSGNAHEECEEDPNNHKGESGSGSLESSENGFRSAASSLPGSNNSSVYNSLERPLQISGGYHPHRNGNGDSDSVSEGEGTTFGSPLSYPSSPTAYWTPLEGSSSQETITNIDGDKTPVNEEGNGCDDHLEVMSCPPPTHRTEHENGNGTSSLRKRGSGASSCGPSLPMYNQNETSSVGVIQESDVEHMIKYAYDPVRRKSEKEASILSGQDWRTLRMDLDKKDQENYRKRYAQEEGNDIEGGGGVECSIQRTHTYDLEEEAEECLEKFPGLVEELFSQLDIYKRTEKSPPDPDLETIATRFNHLAHTFKVEHCNLQQRKDINLCKHEHATNKVAKLVGSLNETIEKFEDISNSTQLPEDLAQIGLLLRHIPEDLQLYAQELSRTSRRVGIMDVQSRLYRMIEVMVLYVHILRNLCAEKDKELQNARQLLEKHNIPFARAKSLNNNNNEKESFENRKLVDKKNNSQKDDDNDQPQQMLQHLLGPKKSNVELDDKIREVMSTKENKSDVHPLMRIFSDMYETLRCEMFWPWNWDDTMKGIKQGFSILLMLLGIFIIFRSVVPIVSADDPKPQVADLGSLFSKHGNLQHSQPPYL